jgi:dephospho-CoA kinase
VLSVGLTGGIGSGKSTVSALLRTHGAVVLDADRLARDVLAVGTAGLAQVVAEFGPEVLRADGSLDRAALGHLVFADPVALRRLNAVVHPLVAARTEELAEHAREAGTQVLVHDVPLLVENDLAGRYDVVVVVAATPATQLDRLVRLRGMTEADARARIGAQAALADRIAVATYVVDNDGPVEQLAPQVDRIWAQFLAGGSPR